MVFRSCISRVWLGCVTAAMLGACGGGGGDSTVPAPASPLDLSFGGDGKVSHVFTASNHGNAVAIQTDSGATDVKIVVAGSTWNGSSFDFAVARYHLDGTPDTTFDGDGLVQTDLSSGDDVANAVAIQPDGKIVVAGVSTNTSGNEVFALVRYEADGQIDATFSPGGALAGVAKTGFGGDSAEANAVALLADGRIVAAGYTQDAASGTGTDFALARYDSDGNLDTTFDSDGKVVTDLAGESDYLLGLAIQAGDGAIVVVGYTGPGVDFVIARYDTGGGLDPGFDTDGWARSNLGPDYDLLHDVVIQPDNRIVAAGYQSGANSDFLVVRFMPDGTPDGTFDGDGVATIDFGGSDVGRALALQSDGKIVVAGRVSNAGNQDFGVARLESDGGLDMSFDGDGKVTIDFYADDDFANALTIQPDAKIVVAGESQDGTDTDFAIVRLNP